MSNAALKKRAEDAKNITVDKFGDKSAIVGNEHYELNVVPTPSLMLDYKLGIGGFPYGQMVELFGSNGLGKTSALGYGVLANVQRQGKLPGIIAMEPHFDKGWAQKLHGLDPEILIVGHPDNAEEAFEMLHEWVYGGLVDYIMVDSIGAMASRSETEEGGKKKAYGASGVITSGLNATIPRLYKNNQGLLIINQQRQAGQSRTGQTFHESPGGEALKHHAQIRIQLKPGKEKYTLKLDGDPKPVVVGRELICAFKKNKMAQAADKNAAFTFFNIETEEYGLGVDKVGDVIATSLVTGVLQKAGAWLNHQDFPKGKLQGKKALAEFIEEEPKIVDVIRKEVMERMLNREIALAKEN
jgi:recombination protein RecA